MAKIKKILIANRGEIAVRIIQTCRQMDIVTVGIYQSIEREYPHALLCDISCDLGQGSLAETYLNQDKIIELAKRQGVDAIHPGYGFLSENSQFAKKVEQAGLVFIGPKSSHIELMGDKKASKEKIQQISVPSIPGYHGSDQGEANLLAEAKKIGFPVLIKASAGGGGKGMRIVEQAADFSEALTAAKSEALKAFSNDQVLIEKYITNPRHIEVQVFSDSFGHHLHLFERECSIQRRYQKIIEETPSSALDEKLRQKICLSAVEITKAINYLGAGTVEFILDQDDSFYFLEMNTRLQVEHPITELITGVDLVKWQILVAQGEELPLTQEQIRSSGHALECRIYAEDPDNQFLPSVGKIEYLGETALSGVRLDRGYQQGNTVTINFDPMLAKLVVYGENRESAIAKMCCALDDFRYLGLKTNRTYLKRILQHEKFIAGETFTNFIDKYQQDLKAPYLDEESLAALILANELIVSDQRVTNLKEPFQDIWQELNQFRMY